MDTTIRLDSIEDAIADFAAGKMVIVVDDEDRENEGDLIVPAEKSHLSRLTSCSRMPEAFFVPRCQ